MRFFLTAVGSTDMDCIASNHYIVGSTAVIGCKWENEQPPVLIRFYWDTPRGVAFCHFYSPVTMCYWAGMLVELLNTLSNTSEVKVTIKHLQTTDQGFYWFKAVSYYNQFFVNKYYQNIFLFVEDKSNAMEAEDDIKQKTNIMSSFNPVPTPSNTQEETTVLDELTLQIAVGLLTTVVPLILLATTICVINYCQKQKQ
uniref:Immunoglobulin V-set domain-containing protein n=1 Tax=Biomphalaria glabrata TaxID=6526 RepID=A0A2C9LYA9_BIOGL